MSQSIPRPSPSAPHVRAALSFIVSRHGEKPRFVSAAMTGGREEFHFDVEPRCVTIENARQWSSAPTLEREGFQLVSHTTAIDDLTDDTAIRERYLAEVEALVAEVLGADTVVAFDATRRSDAPEGASNPDGVRGPAGRIHADYTADSGPSRAIDVLGRERVERALADGRAIVQVNAWRPLTPVERSPLAFADASTIAPEDLIATDQVFPDRIGEIYHLRAGAGQRFGTFPRMTPDEVALILGWDSRHDRPRFTPHSAFTLPGSESAPPRHSIEVRTFAIV